MGVCQAAVLSNVIMISAKSRARRAVPMLVPDKAASGAAKKINCCKRSLCVWK
jgi:hypothetical protein